VARISEWGRVGGDLGRSPQLPEAIEGLGDSPPAAAGGSKGVWRQSPQRWAIFAIFQ